jgi:septum formation protein
MRSIILASQSPRRKQILEWAEVPFEIIVSHTDESFPPQLSIPEIPVHIAAQKAIAVQQQCSPDAIVLAADTVVVLGDHIIGKPVHREEAISMLLALSGATHQVITGVVIKQGNKEIAFHDVTQVRFHPLTAAQIEFYVDRYKPFDKAGSYAIQEWIGVVGIHSIQGDFYNVMGLPISRVLLGLREFN